MRRVLEVFALLLVVALACWPSAGAFHALWTSAEARGNTHGYLVALLSAVLIFQARRELSTAPTQPCARAWALLIVLSVTWLVFWQAGLQDAHLALVPLIAATAIVAVFGFPTLRVLLFPLAFFYFAEPMWEVLSTPLQDLTVAVQRMLISRADLPARVEGYFIRFPNGTFEIESGCSGLHFLVVGLAVAALYGELLKDTLRVRALWMVLISMLALAANWLRVFTVIVAGYQTDMRHYLVSVDHYRFGWVLFILLMAVFFYVTSRFPSPGFKRRQDLVAPGLTAWPARAPVTVSAWVGAVLCIAMVPAIAYVQQLAGHEPRAAFSVELPQAQAPWMDSAGIAGSDWRPRFQNATASSLRVYRGPDDQPLEWFTVIYQRQRQNAELISYRNALFGTHGALVVESESSIDTATGSWRMLIASSSKGQRSMFIWRYLIGERVFTRPVASQLWYGVAALRQPPLSSLIAIRTECVPSCASARSRLESFAVANCLRPGCGAMVAPGSVVSPRSARRMLTSSKGAAEALYARSLQ